MLDVNAALDVCFSALSRELEIEEVNSIHLTGQQRETLARTWRVVKQVDLNGYNNDIEFYIGFPTAFPYEMPYVIVPDDRFRYLPHISNQSRKICLYEDSVVYDASNISGIVRENIKGACEWIERYYGKDNTQEFALEKNSYWEEQYDNEAEVDSRWVLLGKIPDHTCKLKALCYPIDSVDVEEESKCFERVVCAVERREKGLIDTFNDRHGASQFGGMYIASVVIPEAPPFCLTGKKFLNSIADEQDRKQFEKYVNKHEKGFFLFPIGLNHELGGVIVPALHMNRNGFRKGVLRPIAVLTGFENTHKSLNRIAAKVYDAERMAQRTAGGLMTERKLTVLGLGSVGSNLCYYLNGYNNAEFMLVDKDFLNMENIGRHLLGFEYINQRKAHAVAHYLTQYRPDRKVTAVAQHLQELTTDELDKADALFVCTGDIMSERCLLNHMLEGAVTTPAFLLWLEPFGVSGIMLYLNPMDINGIKRAISQAEDSFMKYCLIERHEYDKGEGLIQHDAGCNGNYALYSANDVTMFLSAMFPHIDQLLTEPSETKCYRWTGNIEIAKQRKIRLVTCGTPSKHDVQELPI